MEWLSAEFVIVRGGLDILDRGPYSYTKGTFSASASPTEPPLSVNEKQQSQGKRSTSWLREVLELQDLYKMNITVIDLDAAGEHWR